MNKDVSQKYKWSEIKKLFVTEENIKAYWETDDRFEFCLLLLDISASDDNAKYLVDMLHAALTADWPTSGNLYLDYKAAKKIDV